MALEHTIMTPVLVTGPAIGSVLKIEQGGHGTIETDQNVVQSYSAYGGAFDYPFTWNGNVYMYLGSEASYQYGLWKYNAAKDKFSISSYSTGAFLQIPLFDRIGLVTTSDQGWGMSPEDRRGQIGTASSLTMCDYAISGTDVALVCPALVRLYTWAYPFTSAPAVGPTLVSTTMKRVVECAGKFYMVNINSGGGTLDLYEYGGGALNLVGTPSAHGSLATYAPVTTSQQALFKFNGKLFLMVTATSAGIQMFRLFEFNITTGVSVEQNAYLPSVWTANGDNSQRVMVVRDSITPNEQVFLIHFQLNSGGWECYEFVEGSFTLVDSGVQTLMGGGAVVYDPNAKAAQIKASADSVPSSYVREEIEVFDLRGNGLVDIDPRYRWNSSESPPYSQCTGKSPNDTVTGLASVPTQTFLSDLDDDFADGIIDTELWENVTLAFNAVDRDYGHGQLSYTVVGTIAHETAGAMRFGRAGDLYETHQGVGVRSKSRASGVFEMDFTLADPLNLLASAAPAGVMIVMVRTGVNTGYGFIVWNNSGTPRVRGIYLQANANLVASADFACIDGDVVRINRDITNAWTITHDPGGANNDLTPAGGANYLEDVEIVMGCKNSSSVSWVAVATPIGSEPGISNFSATGAGSPGLYQGGVKHTFDWDHITDLGSGVTGSAELFVDTQRT